MSSSSFRYTAFCLILAIIIDIMGIGLVFPLLPNLFIGNGAAFLAHSEVAMSTREFYYGLAIALWALGIFLGTPFLGDVSDQIGRKKALVICLSMMGVSYLLSALSLVFSNLTLFMLSRLMSGFFGASFPLAQAAFIDLSAPEDKAKNISYVTLASSVGIVFGPLLAAVSLKLASGTLALKLPFVLAACLSFLNAIAIQLLLRETFTVKPGAHANILSAVKACSFMFLNPQVRFLSINFLLLQFAWGLYVQGLPMILAQQFNLSSVEVSLCYILIGISFGFGVLVAQPVILKHMSLKSTYLVGVLVMAFLFLSAGYVLKLYWQVVVILTACIFELFGYTALIALLSNSVSDQEQGKALGGSGAVFGAAWTLIAFLIGHILSTELTLPYYLSGVCGLITFVLMFWYRPHDSFNK